MCAVKHLGEQLNMQLGECLEDGKYQYFVTDIYIFF